MQMLEALKAISSQSPSAKVAKQADYGLVKRAIELMSLEWREQPGTEAIAHSLGLDVAQLTYLFFKWCGLTPKGFMQALTLNYTRDLLRNGHSVMDAAFAAGLSGPSRLHDLYVTHEAMSPGEFKNGGAGLELKYGFHPSPFGEALIVVAPRGLAGLGWVDENDGPLSVEGTGKASRGRHAALDDMRSRWPNARYSAAPAETNLYAHRVFQPLLWQPNQPLKIVLIGSDFEINVWRTLLRIPFAGARSYGAIAADIGKPKAARAVGAAIGRNPISFVVPCHRAIGKSGALTGYHWGLTRKRAILGWEAGQAGMVPTS